MADPPDPILLETELDAHVAPLGRSLLPLNVRLVTAQFTILVLQKITLYVRVTS